MDTGPLTDPHPPGHPEAAAPLGSSEHEALLNDDVEEFARWSGSEDEALRETTVGDGMNPTRARRSHAIRHASDGLEGAWGPDYLEELREDWSE